MSALVCVKTQNEVNIFHTGVLDFAVAMVTVVTVAMVTVVTVGRATGVQTKEN